MCSLLAAAKFMGVPPFKTDPGKRRLPELSACALPDDRRLSAGAHQAASLPPRIAPRHDSACRGLPSYQRTAEHVAVTGCSGLSLLRCAIDAHGGLPAHHANEFRLPCRTHDGNQTATCRCLRTGHHSALQPTSTWPPLPSTSIFHRVFTHVKTDPHLPDRDRLRPYDLSQRRLRTSPEKIPIRRPLADFLR